MRIKMKRFLGILLSLVLVLGLMPGMSLTAYAQQIRCTDLTVGKTLAKDDVIAFTRSVHTVNDVITYYHPFNLTVYMDGSIVKNVSTPQQNSQPDSLYTVPKKCSVVSYSDNLQDHVHHHALYLKSLEISDATIQVTTTTYDGNAHLPDVTVKNASGETLTYNTDYMLSASQTDVGTYSVTVSGIGNYTGSQTLSDAWSITKGTNSFTTQPVSTILAYTGEQIPLLSNGGAAKWGTIQYSMDNESWSTEIPKKTDVGTYTVYYKVPATENYDEISGMVTVSIIQKPTARNNLTYTGEPQELVTAPGEVPEGYAVQYSLDGTNWSTEIPKGTDAGNYTVKVKYVGDDNHTTFDGEDITVTIGKGTAPTLTDDQKPKAKDNLTYTGEPQELVTAPGEVPAGYAVQYSLDGTNWSTEIPKGTDVGNYTVKVKYVGDDNHTTFDGEDIPVTIALELTDAQKPKAKDNPTYTGEPQELVTAPTAALPEPYRIVYALGDANGPTEEYTTSIPSKTNAGTYYVWYKVVGDKNHNDVKAKCLTVKISKVDNMPEDDKPADDKPANDNKAKANQYFGVTATQKGSKVNIKWDKYNGADGYDVYIHYCGSKAKKPAKTIKNVTTTKYSTGKINGKKIDSKKNFHVYVYAYKMVNGKKVVLAKTITAHIVGAKSKLYTNVKSLKLTKSSYTIKVGKTATVKGKITLVDKKKKSLSKGHGAKLRFVSSDKSIATVDKNGKIKGLKKGKCVIYVYTINGLMKKASVTVK